MDAQCLEPEGQRRVWPEWIVVGVDSPPGPVRTLQSRASVEPTAGGLDVGRGPRASGGGRRRSGTDVAREAADLVLLDDDFATIVHAIEQGRSTFTNIRRFLTYHLTDNVAELTPFVVWALSGGQFPLAIGVLRVLALDIGTDLLPTLALGAEPPTPGHLDRPPIRRHLIDHTVVRRALAGSDPPKPSSRWPPSSSRCPPPAGVPAPPSRPAPPLQPHPAQQLTAIVLGQMCVALACRSTRRPIIPAIAVVDAVDKHRAATPPRRPS